MPELSSPRSRVLEITWTVVVNLVELAVVFAVQALTVFSGSF